MAQREEGSWLWSLKVEVASGWRILLGHTQENMGKQKPSITQEVHLIKKKKDNRAEVQGAEMLRETIMKGNCLGSWFSSSRPGFWDAYLNP